MPGAGIIICCQGCGGAGCENNTGCADESPTVLTSCTCAKVASNRLTATLTASASGTITAQGYLRGVAMDESTLDWEYVDLEFTISWSASVDVDLRRIVNDDSYGIGTPSTGSGGPGTASYYASNASGSATWSITDWGVVGAPPDWTEVEADDPAATGGIAAAGSADTLDVGGNIGVGVRKRFSFTDGISPTVYYVTITCGGSGDIDQDLSTTGLGASICDGDSIAVSDSASTPSISYGSGDLDDESADYAYTSQSVSISGSFKRELATVRSGDAECGSCERAFDLTLVQVVTNIADDVVITRTMTGRFVQQCPEAQCTPNTCTWVCGTLTRVISTVTGGGAPVVTSGTQSSIYLNLIAREADGRGLYFADFSFGTPFWAGECPTEDPEPLYPSDETVNVDGSTAVTTTYAITIEPSDPIEGDPECYCDAFTAYDTGEVVDEDGNDLKWEVEDDNESGVFVPAIVETNSFVTTYYAVPVAGAAWVGIDAVGSPYTGIRTYRSRFRVSTPRDLRAKIASDNQTIAIAINGTLVATDATPNDVTSHEQKHTVHLPATAMVSGWNTVTRQVRDDGEVAGALWEWQRH